MSAVWGCKMNADRLELTIAPLGMVSSCKAPAQAHEHMYTTIATCRPLPPVRGVLNKAGESQNLGFARAQHAQEGGTCGTF